MDFGLGEEEELKHWVSSVFVSWAGSLAGNRGRGMNVGLSSTYISLLNFGSKSKLSLKTIERYQSLPTLLNERNLLFLL